jgi:3,4-dihydroxy 2-butanone 4-phosphate synthase/GTP cyclohydrolase II
MAPFKLHAYALQDKGADTVQAKVRLGLPVDGRDYALGAHVLRDLAVRGMRLMTNNPAQVQRHRRLRPANRGAGVAGLAASRGERLKAKQDIMGHMLGLPWARLASYAKVASGAVGD